MAIYNYGTFGWHRFSDRRFSDHIRAVSSQRCGDMKVYEQCTFCCMFLWCQSIAATLVNFLPRGFICSHWHVNMGKASSKQLALKPQCIMKYHQHNFPSTKDGKPTDWLLSTIVKISISLLTLLLDFFLFDVGTEQPPQLPPNSSSAENAKKGEFAMPYILGQLIWSFPDMWWVPSP